MKKLLSVLLAVVLVVGLASVATASSTTDRMQSATESIDYNRSYDTFDVKLGQKLTYPLTADMFEWRSGTVPAAGTPVTRQDVSRASLDVVTSGTQSNVIKSVSIKYGSFPESGNNQTAYVEVEFVSTLPTTQETKFDVNLFLRIGNTRQQRSRLRLQGSIGGREVTVDSGDNYIALGKGEILVPNSSVRNLEIELDKGVILRTNVFSGQRYSGSVDDTITTADDRVLTKYPSISDVLRLETVNLRKTGNYVNLEAYQGRYAYGSNGSYLGRTSQLLPYSTIYYLSTRDLGSSIDVGSGSGGTQTGGTQTGGTQTGGTTTTTTTTTTVSGTVDAAAARTEANKAITKARNSGSRTAVVSLQNKAAITPDGIRAVNTAASNAGLASQIQASTIEGKAVVGRITIFPASATQVTGNIQLGAYPGNAQARKTKALFDKTFSNKIAVVSLDQNGSFGTTVSIAARVDLSTFNKNNIYFYSYNRGTNKYYIIQNPQAWIDSNGYIRFNTSLAGDIVISEGPLTK